MILGIDRPAEATAGHVRDRTELGPLTPYDRPIDTASPGEVFEGYDLTGDVRPRAPITFRDCLIRGGAAARFNTGLVDCNHPGARGVVLERCTLRPDVPTVWLSGVIGDGFTVRDCIIEDTVDGVNAYDVARPDESAGFTVTGSIIRSLFYASPDPNQADGHTHNDGLQVQGGPGVFMGNLVQAYASPRSTVRSPYWPNVTGQAIGVTPNVSAAHDLVIAGNWLEGGAHALTIVPGRRGVDGDSITVTGNRLGRSYPATVRGGVRVARPIVVDPRIRLAGMPTLEGLLPTVVHYDDRLGNSYADTGEPVPFHRVAG